MVMLASDGLAVEPPVRHGTCRLTLTIGGTSYVLRPIPGQPRGVKVFVLRSINGDRAGKYYSVAIVQREAGCTCPDAETNGAVCKHLQALRAIGLLPRSALAAAETKAQAQRVAQVKARRSPVPPPVAPLTAEEMRPVADAPGLARARRAHGIGLARRAKLEAATPPAPPASPFAIGFNAAVRQHIGQLRKGGVN